MSVPRGLGAAGRQLWRSIADEFELGPDERVILLEACRTSDELAALNTALAGADATVPGSKGQPVVNPLYAEVRQHRATLAKLLDALSLPGAEDEQPESWTTIRAREAAQARWRGERGYGGASA